MSSPTSSCSEVPLDPSVIAPRAPAPRTVQLPFGGSVSCFTREQLTQLYQCSHAELGRLLRDKIAPLPVRVDGAIYWFADEVSAVLSKVAKAIERRRR